MVHYGNLCSASNVKQFSSMLFINFAIIYNYILELYNFVYSVPFQEEDKTTTSSQMLES